MKQITDRALVHSSVRPARVLVLVPDALENWQEAMLLLSQQMTFHWAGRWTIAAVPVTAQHQIPSPFVELAAVFDPDYVVRFGPSLQSLRVRGIPHPDIDSIRRQLERAGYFDHETVTEMLESNIAVWPATEGPVVDQVREQLPAFDYYLTEGVLVRLQPSEDVGYPFTGLSSYLEGQSELPALADFHVISPGIESRLLAAWTLGLLSDELREIWARGGGSLVEVPLFEPIHTSSSLDLIWGIHRTPYSFRDYESRLGTTVAGAAPANRFLLGCAVALDRGSSGGFMPETALAVVGDELPDFLLWLLLSRLRSDVYWIPAQFLSARFRGRRSEALRWFALNLLNHIRHPGQRTMTNERLDLTTASLSVQRLGQARRQLQNIELEPEGVRSLVGESHFLQTSSDLVGAVSPRFYAVERQGHRTPAVISLGDDGWSLAPLPSPAPASSVDRALGSKRWIVEYDLGVHLPPSRAIARWLVEAGGVGPDSARITGNGELAVFHPHIMTMGGATIDDTWNLRFRPPPVGIEMLRLLLRGKFEVELMDKGRYYEELLRRIDQVALFQLIESAAFGRLVTSLLRVDDHVPVVWDGTIAAAELETVEEMLRKETASLISAGLLQLMHAIKCRTCRNVELLRIAQLEREMRCRRCESLMSIDDLSSQDFFRRQRVALNGLLTEFLSQRSDAVLSAFELSVHTERMELLPEIVVTSDSHSFNVDLVAMGRGELVLGEVKTGSRYLSNKNCQRYTRRMESIAEFIAPVRLTVVHAWNSDLSSKRSLLMSNRFPTELVLLPTRSWYQGELGETE